MSSSQFDKAVDIIGKLPKEGPVQPSQSEQLKFYGLFKQGTIGDVNIDRPGMMDFTGKAKWDAWNKNKGKSHEDAKKEYVEELLAMFEKHTDNDDAKSYIEQIKSA